MRGSVHLVRTETEIVGIAGIGDAPVSESFVDATFQLIKRQIGERGARARARVQNRASVVDTPSEYPALVLRQFPLYAVDRAELSACLGDPDRLVFLIGPPPNDDLPEPQAAALHPCQCGVRMHQQGDTLRAEAR